MRGPVVYCVEAADNGENLGDLFIAAHGDISCDYDEMSQLYALIADGERRAEQTELYAKYDGRNTHCKIRLIPYYTFANRGDSEMSVWLNVKP